MKKRLSIATDFNCILIGVFKIKLSYLIKKSEDLNEPQIFYIQLLNVLFAKFCAGNDEFRYLISK